MTDPIPPRPSGPHPTPEQLYLARSREDDESRRILRHAAGCAQCSVELARLEAFDAPEALPEGAVEAAWERFGGEPQSRAPRRPPVLALAATLAACIVGLGLWMTTQAPREADVERGAPVTAADWQPSGVLDAPPAAFTFPAPESGTRRVRVFDAGQAYTWTSPPTEEGRVAFPETERRRLRAGVEYFWTVLGGEDTGPARSFRIASPP